MSRIFVGVDVSKEFSTAHGLDDRGEKIFYLRFAMNANGFSELFKIMMKHAEKVTEITVAMESTGCYHINLFSFLSSAGILCVVVNPLLITNFTRLSLRKTKTDKKDAQTIAQFLLSNRESLATVAFSQDTQDLKDLARERESLTVLIAGMKNDIKRLLQGTFPELEKLCSPHGETMLHFLRKFPSARLVKAAKKRDIEKALICPEEKRKRVMVSVEDIIAAAKTSVASVSPAKELILSEKASTLLYLQEKKERITDVLIETCESLRIKELDIIRSIDGVNDITGSTFLAEIGDINIHINTLSNLPDWIPRSTNQASTKAVALFQRGGIVISGGLYFLSLCVLSGARTYSGSISFEGSKKDFLPKKLFLQQLTNSSELCSLCSLINLSSERGWLSNS